MKQIPSLEANSRSATQENPPPSTEIECSSPCSQEHVIPSYIVLY
jgi:hypothetical protein